MLQPIEAAERIRAVAQSTDLPMSAMLDDVAKLLDQVDDSGNYCAARIAELEAELAAARDRFVREGIERVRKFSMVDDGGGRYPVSANVACAMAESTFAEEQQR